LSIFIISEIFTTVSTLSMAVFLFFNRKGKKAVIIWIYFCLLVSIWGITGLGATLTKSHITALTWFQLANIASILCPVVFYHFIISYLDLEKKIQLFILYGIGFIFLYFNFFKIDLYFGEVSYIFNEFFYVDWTKKKGIVYIIFYIGFYWILLLHSFWLLIKNFRHSKGVKRNQLKYFIVGMSIGWLGGHGDFLPAFGFQIYPYSNFLIAIFPIIIGYAIWQHQLMNIEIVIKRSLIYSSLVISITLIYVILVFLTERIFQGTFGYNSSIVSIIIVFTIAMIGTPIKNKIQILIDHLFFKGSTLELAEQNEALRHEIAQSEKFKAVATLASGMAHEIKNPLTAIKTFTEYLPQKLDDKQFLEKFSKIASSEVNRINDLVNQLLDFAKPSPLKLEPTDIHPLIEDTINFLSNQCIQNNIKVSLSLNPYPLSLTADKNQLKQALLNIILNAIEVMKTGGILTIRTEINPSAPQTLLITIKDTGPGIAKEDLKHIFEPFFTKKDGGTGLGLAITYGIIEQHQGKIKVKSTVGKGTEFFIELPVIIF